MRPSRSAASCSRAGSAMITIELGAVEHRARPGGVLPAQSDVDAAGQVTLGVLGGVTHVEDLSAVVSHSKNLVQIDGLQNLFEILVERGALAGIEDRIVSEVGRSIRLVRRDKTNEFLLRHRLQGVIQAPLISERRDGVGGKLLAAERAGAMGGIDQRLVGKRQQFVVQRVIQVGAEIVGCPPERSAQVGTADIADKQRVSRENGMGFARVLLRDRRPGSRWTRWCGRGFRELGGASPGSRSYRRPSSP